MAGPEFISYGPNFKFFLPLKIEQKGITFVHDFGYSFPLYFFPPKKGWTRKGEWISKNRYITHVFVLDLPLMENQKFSGAYAQCPYAGHAFVSKQ